ncbi:uncharacterized protein LOC121599307 isoform X1 [Anopheles merus]|uniref:uncharacterized protein LOC121599307 isoform X1 n=1 Tax=Anopheles merus TaxID=30066 RepID=UPI001BE426B3|nr:uncharacterized protein LOC121599307 isoform X1 [Anopheles merus]
MNVKLHWKIPPHTYIHFDLNLAFPRSMINFLFLMYYRYHFNTGSNYTQWSKERRISKVMQIKITIQNAFSSLIVLASLIRLWIAFASFSNSQQTDVISLHFA